MKAASGTGVRHTAQTEQGAGLMDNHGMPHMIRNASLLRGNDAVNECNTARASDLGCKH